MAFGKSKPASYGVPVRAAAPPSGPDQAAYGQQGALAPVPWAAAPSPPPPAGVYAPVVGAPVPMGAQFASAYAPQAYAPQAPAYAPQAATANPYAPLAPTPYPPQQSWAPAPYANQGWAPAPPGYQPPPKSNVARNVIVGVLAAVVGLPIFAAVAIPVFLNSRRPKLPTTLAGRTRMDAAALKQFGNVEEQFRSAAGNSAVLGIYQEVTGQPAIVLVAGRGRMNEQKEISEASSGQMPIDISSRRQFGEVACYSAVSQPVAACFWSSGVSGMVIVFRTGDLQEAAAIAAEAKSALN